MIDQAGSYCKSVALLQVEPGRNVKEDGSTCANLGILISSLLIGGLVSTIGYTPFFIALAALDLVAAVAVWTVIRKPATHA